MGPFRRPSVLSAGFDVVHPENLPIAEQIRLASGAAVIGGNSGSALHLSAFAPPGRRVIEVGDSRAPHRPVVMQTIIDSVRQHPQAHIPYTEPTIPESALAGLGL